MTYSEELSTETSAEPNMPPSVFGDCTAHRDTIDLLEEEIPHLRRFARYLARDPEFADDVVQDCLVRAIENIEKWKPGTSLRAWLFVILRNLFLNHKRRHKLERNLFASSDVVPETSTPSPQEDSLALKETEAALRVLSAKHREVLLLVTVEGLSYEETATKMDVSLGTVKSRVSRARSALKAEVEKTNIRRPANRSYARRRRTAPNFAGQKAVSRPQAYRGCRAVG